MLGGPNGKSSQFRDSSFEAIPSGCNPIAIGADDHSRDCNEDRRFESEVVVN